MIENADLADNIEYTNESNDAQKGQTTRKTVPSKKDDHKFIKRNLRKNKLSEGGSGAVAGLEPSDSISAIKSNSHQRSSTGKRRQSPPNHHNLMMTSQFASSSAAAIAGKDTTTNANTGAASSNNTKEEKELARMGQRYMRLMTDNKWMVDLEKMGRNLDSLKFREK